MSNREVQREFIEEPEKKDWRPRFDYDSIVRNLPFLLFLSLIALIYIANGHYAVKNVREINKLGEQVRELHWRYLDAKTDLMLRSKMSEVYRQVSPMGLQIPVTPPLEVGTGKNKDE